jgi:N-methylhydantoinase A
MLDRAKIPPDRRRFVRAVDARYERQSYELTIHLPRPVFDGSALAEVAEGFHERHRLTYGHDNRAEPVQLVNIRLTAIGAIPPLGVREAPAPAGTDPLRGRREAWFRGHGGGTAAVYARERMPAGLQIAGPAVIESLESTILVPPSWQARMDDDGYVLLRRRPDPGSDRS